MQSASLITLLLTASIAVHQQAQTKAKVEKSPDSSQTETVSNWLSRSAIRLKSVEAGHSFDDLQPLKSILKDVRIVGLGEGTHGTREFFQIKHRLLEFLVNEMGFTLFVMEGG